MTSNVESAWFGTISRRLFAIFLLFALIPTILLSALSLRYVGAEADRQVQRMQEERLGMLVDTLLGRLEILNERLASFVEYQAETELQQRQIGEEFPFGENRLRLLPLSALDRAMGLRSRETTRERLAEGRVQLARIAWDDEPQRPYLVRALRADDLSAGLVAVVTPATVFFLFDLVLKIRFPRGILTNLWYG